MFKNRFKQLFEDMLRNPDDYNYEDMERYIMHKKSGTWIYCKLGFGFIEVVINNVEYSISWREEFAFRSTRKKWENLKIQIEMDKKFNTKKNSPLYKAMNK